jgi:hypothetical protein
MRGVPVNRVFVRVCLSLLFCASTGSAAAATLTVCASGCDYSDLQAAIDAASPGDTIRVRAGETFVGPFLLRAKSSSSTAVIEIRSDAADSLLPAEGVRLVPSGKPGANTDRSRLPRLVGRGDNYRTTPVVSTEPGAHHYILRFLEIDGSANEGWETLIALGDDTTAAPAHDITLDRVYAHGDLAKGQKRGIALNSVRTDILNSYISDIRAVGFDSQAIAGWNGAGPFRIINNYLEAAGENIMFGGGDPAVYNLVPTGIEISRNHITKLLDWQSAILRAPGSASAWDSGTGGSISAGTHYFKVVAVMDTGPMTAESAGSNEASATVPGSRAATVSWSAVPGADRYRIYRGTSSGGQSVYMETSSAVTNFQYTGVGERSGTVPRAGTLWSVKNLVELKNAENVTVDRNVIENIWPAGQNGYAIMITPRNQSGGAPWVRVRDVSFTNNIIRNALGVLSLTGYDDYAASQQTRRVTFRNNLIYDIDPLSFTNKTFVMGESPATITIDHNTIIQKNNAVVFPYGSPIYGFSFTNNVTPHNEYGIFGDNAQTGSYTINLYFPDGVVRNNVFGGGPVSLYPSPNAFPTLSEWTSSFADLTNDDYRIRSSSSFYSAGEGGSLPGADLGQLYDATKASGSATTPPPDDPPTDPANTAPVAQPGGPYSAVAGAPFIADGSGSSDAEGSVTSYMWRWHDDILIRAADVPAADIVGSGWTRTERSDAADGVALWNPDAGAPKAASALASPSSYVDVKFQAAAGVPYRLWMRTRAGGDAYWNDSLFLQFSGRVDADGRAIDRIGTTEAARLSLEEGTGAGVSGWGWNDELYGAVADPIYFATSGPQTIRIQQREDGIMWDQIVISSDAYRSSAPGSTRNDATVVPATLGTSSAAVASHTYQMAGQYPILLTVKDAAGAAASAATSVNVTGSGSSALTADAGGPYNGSVGASVTFDGSVSQASSGAGYSWEFGDESVIHASRMTVTGSRWQKVSDTSAAGGTAVYNADWQQPKTATAMASPQSFVEATFRAAQGVPYRLWIRMRADNDDWNNDAIFVQFSGSVDASGQPVNRIGTSAAMSVALEEGQGAGLFGWGWADGGYGFLDAPIYFNADGVQRIRIQQRQDGPRIDQIVISADRFATTAPGSLVGDATIVPEFGPDAQGPVVSHRYRFTGIFPVQLLVADASASSVASTTATIR